ncbi:MAG: biosynthetic-type acetolactate synthase large subunit [Erysipelotrichaceae bacterium]|nr:biosynthetic-type acetolactate synthase large subunit [Erysipelotrichaceae bacterium]
MMLRGADILVKTLVEQGVDVVFGFPGGAVLEIYDALYHHKDEINHVITCHEQGAAHAAEGYAKTTGKVGVAIATSGPGATNLVTGIADAYLDSVPTVFITGNVSTNLIGKDSFQETYITGVTMPITKHNFVVRDVNELANTVREAFRIANSGRKGPVLIDLPKDITMKKAEYKPVEIQEIIPKKYDNSEMIDKVAKLINNAKRPVVYCGGGIVASEASQVLREFVEKANIPATYTLMAAGVLGYEEKLNLGMVGMHGTATSNLAIDHSDVLLALGVRFDDRVASNVKKFAKNAKIVHIDIDASEINKNVYVDYSLVGDVKDILTQLIEHVEYKERKPWLEQIEEWKKKDYIPKDDDSILRPHQILKTISDNIGEDGIIVTDVGQHQMWAAQYNGRVKSRHFVTSGGLGTMGFGYGAALGAKIANKDKDVIHITGDGSFNMNLNEVITSVNHGIKIITVLFNNKSLGMVRQWQHHFYDDRFSETDLFRKTDYLKLAEAFGAKGYHCTNLAEFEDAFKKALENPDTAIIECMIDRDERVLPLIPAGKTIEEIIMD